jgi:hypothetical protein
MVMFRVLFSHILRRNSPRMTGTATESSAGRRTTPGQYPFSRFPLSPFLLHFPLCSLLNEIIKGLGNKRHLVFQVQIVRARARGCRWRTRIPESPRHLIGPQPALTPGLALIIFFPAEFSTDETFLICTYAPMASRSGPQGFVIRDAWSSIGCDVIRMYLTTRVLDIMHGDECLGSLYSRVPTGWRSRPSCSFPRFRAGAVTSQARSQAAKSCRTVEAAPAMLYPWLVEKARFGSPSTIDTCRSPNGLDNDHQCSTMD